LRWPAEETIEVAGSETGETVKAFGGDNMVDYHQTRG
jgi:hypothetical protein